MSGEETMMPSMNFGDLPLEYSDLLKSKIVILPVPYDQTSTWIKGAALGPAALLAASPHLEFYDIETDSEVFRQGIFTAEPVTGDMAPEMMTDIVRDVVGRHLAGGKFVVVIGGEHSVSIGAVKAHKETHKDICVLQLDAHLDLRSSYKDSRFNHACVMARVRELCPIVQAGIRSMDSLEKNAWREDDVFLARDMQTDDEHWMRMIVSRLRPNVYVTIDLDVLDPAVMPSTGTPEPGGLHWYPVLGLLKKVADQRNIVGFDIVELCPQDANKAPDFLAAKLLYKLLGYVFQ